MTRAVSQIDVVLHALGILVCLLRVTSARQEEALSN